MTRLNLPILLIVLALTQISCTNISYYSQSISGHFEVMNKRRSITDVLSDETLDAAKKNKLVHVLELLDFARDNLKLPANGSYQHYSDIGRPYVVWNVFATPEFSLTPIESCFLFVGCLSYRGFFAEADAKAYADALNAQSMDVFLGGVAAYSTLNWFNDPVLNTMLKWDINYLSRVILHELAHQKLYLKGDSAFNEAFADSIAELGLERWLQMNQQETTYQVYLSEKKYEDEFINLVLSYKTKLEKLYSTQLSDSHKRKEKKRLFQQLEDDYLILRKAWNNYQGFDNWFKQTPNNARISAISTYREYIPGLLSIYEKVDKDIEQYYDKIEQLVNCSALERKRILLDKPENWSC